MQGLLGSEIVGANEEFVHINGRLHNSQAASFMTRTGLQVISPCCIFKLTALLSPQGLAGPSGRFWVPDSTLLHLRDSIFA